MSDTVTRDDAGGVATLTLQRPGLSSALRRDLLLELRRAELALVEQLVARLGAAARGLHALRGQRDPRLGHRSQGAGEALKNFQQGERAQDVDPRESAG